MTLSTDIYLRNPLDPEFVFRRCQALIAAYDLRQRSIHAYRVVTTPNSIGNAPWQNLPAWLTVYHNNGSLIVPDLDNYVPDDPDDPDISPSHYVRVNFDTAYGYTYESETIQFNGASDLHAALISRLGLWLHNQNILWSWRNEFTGLIHDGYAGLGSFGNISNIPDPVPRIHFADLDTLDPAKDTQEEETE